MGRLSAFRRRQRAFELSLGKSTGESSCADFKTETHGIRSANSCCGRRMADTAVHLVDRVIPPVPVRQCVLSLPYSLRFRVAFDADLLSKVLAIFIHEVFGSLRRRAREYGIPNGKCGSVTFVQRFGLPSISLHTFTLSRRTASTPPQTERRPCSTHCVRRIPATWWM
jgi:hypothetical protein